MHLHDVFETHPHRAFSPAFKSWFGDSKIVDERGDPLVVYHGTTSDIEAFAMSRVGTSDQGWYGHGIYLTAAPDSASAYAGAEDGALGGNVIPCYVSMRNPYVWPVGKSMALRREDAAALTARLKSRGHDGVVVPNPHADGAQGRFFEIVAFSPNQVKSIWNKDWNPESDHLSEAR